MNGELPPTHRPEAVAMFRLEASPYFRWSESWGLRFSPTLIEAGWPLRVRGVLEHMFYLELGDARG
jgi:hypothetical protein